MTPPRLLLPALALACAATALAQYAPPPNMPPDEATLKEIDARKDRLDQAVKRLRSQGVKDPALGDVEVYLKAVEWVTAHEEFYQKDAGKWALEVLDRGLLRASQAGRGEAPWLGQAGFASARAYRSRLDDSVQPYAVTLPAGYGRDRGKKYPLHVVLHGRTAALTEVSFLHSFNGDKAAPKEQDWVQLDLYGRGNNAYRWAGESDVLEAVDHFVAVEAGLGRGALLDLSRTVLRGFSMGGAGTWHLGLHRPDRYCVIAPGAGFTTTKGYTDKLPDPLPPYVEACLHIYDAVDYAENAFNTHIVAYSGGDDPQKKAADNIEAALLKAGLQKRMKHVVALGLKHQFPAEWQKTIREEYAQYVADGRPDYPEHVRFVTYTLKYPSCSWVDILSLEQHYRRALVDATAKADGFDVKTENLRSLCLRLRGGETVRDFTVAIDGQEVKGKPRDGGPGGLLLYLEKRTGRWSLVLPERLAVDRLRRPQKMAGLQGPIDDAFTAPFLCVRGTGQAWHEATAAYAQADLERFRFEWSKYFRGELPVKRDDEVTPEDIATKNLILFGDPSSNSLVAQALPGLPFRWSKDKITWGGKEYDAASTVPALVYPSPLNAERYVVLNSGHTFHKADFEGTNALLYPRLGDHALLKVTGPKKDALAVEVLEAGLFDDFWQFAPRQ
jgi:pimeloyl-ACP methyl ester carboxylesterase